MAIHNLVNILIITILFTVSCQQNSQKKQVIANVGNRVIYLDDFKNRAEFTIRPSFLKGANINAKRIVLNSLIAEKILAIEAEKDSAIINNEKLRKYVKGIKEQNMRELFFKHSAFDQVVIDEEQIEEIVRNANRRFELSYFDIAVTEDYDSVARILKDDKSAFEGTVQQFYPQRHPQRQKIIWRDVINTVMFEHLFTDQVEPGDIIGPVIRQDNRVFFFHVEGWHTNVTLSENDTRLIRKATEKQLRATLAAERYETVISELMAGKELVFNMQGLVPLINMLGPIFLKGDQEFSFIHNPLSGINREVKLDTLRRSGSPFGEKIVLKIDGKTWRIDDILEEMHSHPLIFRKRRFAGKEFGEQLKLGLVDLIRDHYITKKAYEMGFDNAKDIKDTKTLWKDHFYAILMRQKLLYTKTDSLMNDMEYINQMVKTLRTKYSSEIIINEKLLDKTEIADVQLLAFQRNVPFPLVSPSFPLLSLDDN